MTESSKQFATHGGDKATAETIALKISARCDEYASGKRGVASNNAVGAVISALDALYHDIKSFAASRLDSVPSEIADSGALADILMDSLKEAGHVIGLATALHVVNAMRFRTIPSAIRQKCEHVTCDDVNALISGRDLLQRIHDDLKIRAEFNDDESVVDLSRGIWRDLVKYLEVK